MMRTREAADTGDAANVTSRARLSNGRMGLGMFVLDCGQRLR